MEAKVKDTVIVEVSGGNVQNVWGLQGGQNWELLDWDNLLGDTYTIGDCGRSWMQLSAVLRDDVRRNYVDDYPKIRERINEEAEALSDCPSCGAMHLPAFTGDCREDDERYNSLEDYLDRHDVEQLSEPESEMEQERRLR